jgi:uncharacterized protein YajQ (UPF0234 family)
VPSFDVVSQVDMQEVSNALQQTRKEVEQRYDFKGSKTELELEKNIVKITSDNDFKVKAVVDILQSKFVKRNINLKSLEYGKVESASGGMARQLVTIHQGLDTDAAREVVKLVKETKIKVQAQVQDDQVRVTGKKRDELQAVIQALRAADFRRPLQFVNMRD